MIVVPILLHAELGRNENRDNGPHYIMRKDIIIVVLLESDHS